MSNETPPNDIHSDPDIQITETADAPTAEASNPPVSDKEESKFSNATHKTTEKMKEWRHDFVELKINRQLYIIISLILFVGLIFGGAIEKIIIIMVAVPLLVSGITGQMFLEKMVKKMPWNKAKKAADEVAEESKDL